MSKMRKHITTGIRVSARRGPFLPKALGQRRAQRQIWFGNVIESVEGGLWKVAWDSGHISEEKSSQLAVHANSAGRQPVLP